MGIVAGVCREIGLATSLDAFDKQQYERVSVGTVVVAMILNGLGFSNRRLYLVLHCFANKPVAHLLGSGITAEDLNNECLGRALEWLYVHDPTALLAGIAARARRVFGVQTRQLHADTTSSADSGTSEPEEGDLDALAIAITYGYSRDHREGPQQWMLGVVTPHDGDVPVGLQALDGNASDQVSLPELVALVLAQVRAARAAGRTCAISPSKRCPTERGALPLQPGGLDLPWQIVRMLSRRQCPGLAHVVPLASARGRRGRIGCGRRSRLLWRRRSRERS